MPENLQESTRAKQSQDAISSMEDALESLNEACDEDVEETRQGLIDDAIDSIENATV